jgi:hypothetical protein
MSGKVNLPGDVVWRENDYAATIEGSFFRGYEVRLFWLNDHAMIWHDQSYRNSTQVRFSSKSKALEYANNDLRAVKKNLDARSEIIRSAALDKNVNNEKLIKMIRLMEKL